MTELNVNYECSNCGTVIQIKEKPNVSGHFLATVFCPCCYKKMAKEDVRKPTLKKIRQYFDVTTDNIKDIEERLIKARKMFYNGNAPCQILNLTYGYVYSVESEKGDDKYLVTEKNCGFTCNCPDHLHRPHIPCKHIMLVLGRFY